MLVYSAFFLHKTVWAMGQLLRELPSSLVWVFSMQSLSTVSDSIQGMLRSHCKERRSDPHRKHGGKPFNRTARPNYYRKSRFISESIIMRLTCVQDLFDAFFSLFLAVGGSRIIKRKE